ncbi:titin homolog [Sinocyclocheilus rhinocerous]|uniref:titin homolog n=1 Tax=Sinocyclocheilus rhinocerous TaxID=307959 RepID=UPI0007BA9F3B|nr:PREDICTED: titin homolog [Sinocyclocheilus rhinocerous]
MKDFVLSLLSRGYGQIVPNEDGHDGRLEVCFEPQDYFNWKSQPPLLRLTSSGRFFGGLVPVPPKTYSTRRGPLILYSEDLALAYRSGQVNRKRKAPSCPKQEAEKQLHTLQDLTGAILAFGKKKTFVGSLAGVTHPLLPDKHVIQNINMHHRPEEKNYNSSQVKGENTNQIKYQPRFLCSPRPNRADLGPLPPITDGLVHVQIPEKTQAASDEQMTFKTKEQKEQLKEKPKERKRPVKSLRIAADTCRAHMSPIPETEPAHRTEDQTETPATKKITSTILPHLIDHPKDLNNRGKRSRMESGGGVGEMCTLRSVYVDPSLECSPLSRVNYYGGHMEGSRQMRHCGGETHMRRVNIETDPSFTVFHLPPINQSPLVNSSSDITLTMNQTEIKEKKSSCENLPKRDLHVHLPDIKEGTTHENPSERRMHNKVLLLFPAQTEHTDTHQPEDDLHRTPVKETEPRGDLEHAVGKQDPLSDSKCRIIEMDLRHVMWSDDLEKGDQHPPLGPLPPLVGRRGPGKQSSMAVYRQNLHDPADTTETQTGITRGCLPLELREWQGGQAVGTLIMGPDGEIIRLSLWDPAVDTKDHPIMGDVTQGHVLKVVTSEGDLRQPWTILIEDHDTDEEEDTTSNTEETTLNTEQLDSSHEEFKVSKTAEKMNTTMKRHPLGSHNKTVRKRQVSSHEETNAEEEEEEEEEEVDEEVFRVEAHAQQNNAEDDFGSDCQIIQKERVIKVRSHAEQTKAKRKENRLGADNEIIQDEQVYKVRSRAKQTNAKKDDCLGADSELIQEEKVFKVRSRAKQTNAKRKDDCLGADSEIVHETQTFKVRSHAKQTKAKRKEDCFGSESEIIQDEQIYLPEERLEEMSSSTTHQLNKTGEEATGVQRNRKVKTTTLQPETKVTRRSRKSKGAAPAISPKSTHFTPRAHSPDSLSPEGQSEIQTGLPTEAEKGHSENTGGREDTEHTLVEKVKKNKKSNKQTGKSKGTSVQIHEDIETQNTSVPDDPTSTSKKKKKKTGKQKKEETKEEKEEPIKAQNLTVKVKKKKGQPAFVVGKPRPQDVEWMANPVDEPERLMTHEREVTTHDSEDELENTENTPEHTYTDSDMDADTDRESTDTHEAHEDSPRSVYSTHRSQQSLITASSEVSIHRLSQSSIRTPSMRMGSHCSPCSPAPLSLIYLPPQSALPPASDPTKSEPGNDVKSNEVPTNQTDKKAAALAEKAECRRLEVEKKRKEREEEKKRQQEKEATEERMRLELEEEQRKRAEEVRLQKIREEDERERRQEEEMERQRRERAEKDRERRRQEEKRRLLERLQRERQEEEKRQAAQLERQRLEEEARKEEELRKLSEMEEAERLEYLRRQQEQQEERRKAAEERRRKEEGAAMHAEEEARLQAELFARQRAALEQHLKFQRGLFVEADGLEQTQDISRPWIFSYFTLLKLLGLDEAASEDTLKDVL